MAHLEEFIKAVKTNGGILAYGTIDERSFHPLTSMQIRKVVGRLDERAAINQRNNASLKTFKETAEPLLNHPRNARRTDIAGSLERFELFFDEPTSSEAKKIFIMISDGLDTTSRRAGLYKIRLPEGTEIYTIGIEKTLAKNIFGQKVKCLESLEAALRTLAIQAR